MLLELVSADKAEKGGPDPLEVIVFQKRKGLVLNF